MNLKRGDKVYAVHDFRAFTTGVQSVAVPIEANREGEYVGLHDNFPKVWFERMTFPVVCPIGAILPCAPMEHLHE